MKKFNILLILFSIILFSSFVSAGIPEDLNASTNAYYKFEDNINDSTPRAYHGTTKATSSATGKINRSYLYNGATTTITNTTFYGVDGSQCFAVWIRPQTYANDIVMSQYNAGSEDIYLETLPAGNFLVGADGLGTLNGFGTYTTNSWTHVVVSIDASNNSVNLFTNGTFRGSSSTGTNTNFTSGIFWSFGDRALDFKRPFTGWIDEGMFKNGTCSQAEVTYLFASGSPDDDQQYDYNAVPVTGNDSVESTTVVKQIGTTVITTPTLQTILSSNFNITINNTELYDAYSFNVESNLDNTMYCELSIDGNVIATKNRTNIAGVLGSVFIMSPHFNLTNGTHTQTLSCSKIGAGKFTISNAIGIGHIFIDQNNNTIPHDSLNISENVISGSSFTEIGEINFTISDKILVTNRSKFLVLEWAGNYFNNDASAENLSTYISINNSNCSFYPRTVSASGSGSVGGDCLIRNATSNATYNIKIYGNGTNAQYNINLIVKEFTLNGAEIAGGTGGLEALNFSGNNDTLLFNISGGNINHALTNVFEKIALNIVTNEATQVTLYAKVRNGTNFTTVNFIRDFESGLIGSIIGNDILENVPQDSYVSELWANCGSPTAFCDIVGGDGIGYITDVTTVILNAFNISVFDNFDNSSILNFTVSNGLNLTTTSGSVNYFTTEPLINLTITSNFNGGYFSTIIMNHNTSNDLNVSLNQTYINWNCIEKITNNSLTCLSPTSSQIFNYNVIGNPHTQSVNVSAYIENNVTFNVTALQNETLNATMFSTILSLNSSSTFGTVTSCTYVINSITVPGYTENVSGIPNSTANLINGTYNVTADCTGSIDYAFLTLPITINETFESLNFTLQPSNSINFTFYSTDAPTVLLNGTNITIALVFQNNTASNYSTNTGFLFVQDLNIGSWEIRYDANTYSSNNLFFEVTNRSTQNISLYLANETGISQVLIQVRDLSDKEVVGAKVRLQQQFIAAPFNGQFVTISECITNDDGECFMFIQESASIVYRFIVLIDDVVIKTTAPDKILFLANTVKVITIKLDIGANLVDPLQQLLNLYSNLELNETTNNVSTYTFIDGNNAIVRGCYKIERRILPSSITTTVFEQCVNGFNGDIVKNWTSLVLNNSELIFIGTVDYIGSTVELQRKSLTFLNSSGNNLSENDNVLLLIIVFSLISFAILQIPNLIVQIVLDFAIGIGAVILGITVIGVPVIMLFLVLGLLLAWNRKNARGQI